MLDHDCDMLFDLEGSILIDNDRLAIFPNEKFRPNNKRETGGGRHTRAVKEEIS